MFQVLAVLMILAVGVALTVFGPRGLGREAAPVAAGPAPRHLAVATTPVGADPISRLVDVLRRRKWLRRSLSVLVQSRLQSKLDRQIASPELRQAYLERRVAVGDSLTRIIIKAIDVDVVVVEGTTASALRAGAGHYPDTPLPCEVGNVGIAGHRTTYGRPFHNLDRLSVGDVIILETPIGRCTYKITKAPFVVAPERVDVVKNTPDVAALTLTTCHPKGSARERLIIRAELVSSTLDEA
jgi:LPXTG-site transpeptidase (sortase) family protein